jgi:WD40 repeat protein
MRIEPQLVEEVLDQVSTGRIEQSITGVGAVEGTARVSRIETPYLQLVLQRLWEVERAQGSEVMRLETFEALGGAERIVQDHLERAMRGLSPAERAAAATVFGHLVTPSGTKIAHGTSDLATYAELEEGEIRPVLDSLARQRILRPLGENGHAGGRYEIFHDVLAGAVLAWSTRHEADAALEEERKRRRRLGWLASAALVGLALMAALAAYAFTQRSKAQQQAIAAEQAQQQAENASSLLETKNTVLRRTTAALAVSNAGLKKAKAHANTKAREAALEKEKADHEAEVARAESEHADNLAAQLQYQLNLAEKGKQREEDLRRRAEEALARANRLKLAAQQATKNAQAAGKRARASYFIARSVSLVGRDPEESASAAISASALAEEPGDQLDAENALRAALVAIRVQHVLPGAGATGSTLASLSASRPKDGARVAHFSANGRRVIVAVGGGSTVVRVYRARDARLLKLFTAPAVVNDAALSSDGRFAAAAGANGKVYVWDVDGNRTRTFDHEAPVTGVAWSPRGDILVSVGTAPRPSARVWDVSTGFRLHLFRSPTALKAAVFSPDGMRFATYGEGRFARIYDLRAGALLSILEHPTGLGIPVTSLAFSPSGDTIVTGRGRVARLFNVETGEEIRTFTPHTGTVSDVAFSPDGVRVATGSIDTVARLWTVATGALDDAFYGGIGLGINDIDFSPVDPTAIVSAGADHTARYSAKGQLSIPLLGHDGPVLEASFSPDGASILTSSKDGTARLWDPYGEPVPQTLQTFGDVSVTALAVDQAGTRIAVGREDGQVAVLTLAGKVLRTLLPSGPKVVSVGWGRKQTLMAATSDGRVRIWRDAGTSLLSEFNHGAEIGAAAISPDAKLVATAPTGSDHRVRLRTLATRKSRVLRHEGSVRALAFDPTSRFLATGSGEAAYIWPTDGSDDPKKLEPEGDTGNVIGVAFGDRGHLLATSSDDSYSRIWNARTGVLRNTLVGHGGPVVGLSFSPDGRWLATAGPRKAGVWQIGKSNLAGHFLFFVAPPLPQQGNVTSVAFAHNQTLVFGTARTTRVPYGAIRAYRCDLCGGLKQLVAMASDKLAHLRAEARR